MTTSTLLWVSYLPNTFLRIARTLQHTFPFLTTADIELMLDTAFNIAARNCRCFPFIKPAYDYTDTLPVEIYLRTKVYDLIHSLEPIAYSTLMDSVPDEATAEIVNLEVTRDFYVKVLWKM